jgi:rare lipoprotein A
VTTGDNAGRSIWRLAALSGLTCAILGVSGCRHGNQAQMPPPQAMPPPAEQPVNPPPLPPAEADLRYVETHRPLYTQVGNATWYSAPYEGRRTADGQVFSDSAMTAAHRTLPMGSLIEVTNLVTGQSGVMRVTDRGPFVEGRILDMTIASAKATGVYRSGVARVRIDVYETPKPLAIGGRWCVQIGAFHSEGEAIRLKRELESAYPTANVIEFPGQERSFWVRIRPKGDNRQMAVYIERHIHPSEGNAFLTRLD